MSEYITDTEDVNDLINIAGEILPQLANKDYNEQFLFQAKWWKPVRYYCHRSSFKPEETAESFASHGNHEYLIIPTDKKTPTYWVLFRTTEPIDTKDNPWTRNEFGSVWTFPFDSVITNATLN